jgi:hypothetical protein
MIEADNKDIAKNISLEKPDVSSSATAPEVENSQPVTPPPATGQPVVDAAGPVVPAQTAAPALAQPTAQSGISVDSSIAANEAPSPAPAAPESVPAVQGQAQ